MIDPSLVQAMILDQPGGLAITDSRFHSGGNPTVYTKDQNATVQPRLFVQFAPSTDTTPPTAVGSLAAAPGMDNGTVELSFTAPSDVDDAKAFGYTVRYSTAGRLQHRHRCGSLADSPAQGRRALRRRCSSKG